MPACGKKFVPVIECGTSGLKTMKNFSFKHNLQDFVMQLKMGAFEIIYREILKVVLQFFSFQK